MGFKERITIDPEVRSGKPCIRGTRITVYDVLEYLAGGMTEDQILEDFPSLEREDIRATLAFAAARERRLASSIARGSSSTSDAGIWRCEYGAVIQQFTTGSGNYTEERQELFKDRAPNELVNEVKERRKS